MPNKITTINDEYFGVDMSKTYLKDDFSAVLRGVVQRGVILDVFLEASKARHDKEELENGSMVFGDFDPDNAGFLSSIFEIYQKGLMVDVRQLLVDGESGAGGKFIKDIQKLTTDDFVDFYMKSKPGSTNIPPLLLMDFMNAHDKDKSIKGTDFIDGNRTKIENTANALVAKAKQFQSKGYFSKIVRDYQALEFHKENRPEKYDTREEVTDFPFMNGKMTIKSRKSKVEIKSIAECLNDFAEIVMTYQSLVGKNTDLLGSNWPLDTYIERTFGLFSKAISNDIKRKAAQDIVKYLHKSIDIVGWGHRKVVPEEGKT